MSELKHRREISNNKISKAGCRIRRISTNKISKKQNIERRNIEMEKYRMQSIGVAKYQTQIMKVAKHRQQIREQKRKEFRESVPFSVLQLQ